MTEEDRNIAAVSALVGVAIVNPLLGAVLIGLSWLAGGEEPEEPEKPEGEESEG
jgi:hypothetical protein